jgi:hypothetical protein
MYLYTRVAGLSLNLKRSALKSGVKTKDFWSLGPGGSAAQSRTTHCLERSMLSTAHPYFHHVPPDQAQSDRKLGRLTGPNVDPTSIRDDVHL